MELQFTKNIDSTLLDKELTQAGFKPVFINTENDLVTIKYESELSEAETLAISDIVNAHVVPQKSNVPEFVTRRQMKLALVRSGIALETIEGFINQLPEPQKTETKIWWNDSQNFIRDNAVLNQMAPLLHLTPTQVDQLFIYAATL